MTFFDDMAAMAGDLLKPSSQGGLGAEQGVVELKRVTVSPPPNDWTPGTETTEIWPLKATVKRVHQRYENGVLIVETGDIVMFAVPEIAPQLSDMIVIDGETRPITSLTPIPPAGTVVAWKAWCGLRPRTLSGA